MFMQTQKPSNTHYGGFSVKSIIAFVVIPILISGAAMAYRSLNLSKTLTTCNLTHVLHRHFDHYYGLINIENQLSYLNAEQENTINSKCKLFYDHLHLFPNGNLPLSKSIIIKGLRGTGKSQIRQCILNKIPQRNHIVVNIYGTVIHKYLDNFVKNSDITDHAPHEKIRQFWKKEHFFQVILAELTLRFVNDKYLSILKEKLNTISSEARHEMATLLSFYSTKYPDTLCNMVNVLLGELTKCKFRDCSIQCDSLLTIQTDTQMFSKLKDKHREIKIASSTAATDASLKLIQLIYGKTKILPTNCLDRSYHDQLIFFINFINSLDIGISVVVDSLDESKIFFNNNDINLLGLQKFVDSVTDDDILFLALGNWGRDGKMSSGISFYILVPDTPKVPVNISWTRPDKIAITDLKWNEVQLINYVDFVFDDLRKKSRNECKKLPDICTLLGGEEKCIQTMKQLRHPRDFHIFFSYLIEHMGIICNKRDSPFIATEQDLKTILEKTKNHLLTGKLK